MRRLLPAALVTCALTLAMARAEPPPARSSGYFDAILLDADAGADSQRREAERAIAAAKSGDAQAQYLVGSLYRLGMRHPAKVFERDDDKAWVYLSNAATHGQIQAMAAMAELELRRDRGMDAMVWAQAFALYEKEAPKGAGANDRQAYAAYLLERCYEKTGRGEDVERMVLDAFVAFQQNHGARIRAGLGNNARMAEPDGSADPPLAATSPSPRPLGTPGRKEVRMKSPGLALFLLGIDASGTVQRRLVVDSLPDETFADGLAGVADHLRFTAAPDAPGLRWAMVPIGFDDQRYFVKHKAE